MSVKVQADKKVKRERRLRDACEQELMKYREYCAAQENEIEILRGMLRKHGITDFIPREIHRPVSRINVIAEVTPVSEKLRLEKEKMDSYDPSVST